MRKIIAFVGMLLCGIAAINPSSAIAADADPTIPAGNKDGIDDGVALTPVSHVALGNPGYYIPPDTYTRLVVCDEFKERSECAASENSGGPSRDADPSGRDYEVYPYKKRDPFSRFMVGVGHSENLTVNIKAGNFTASVPLASLSHNSTRSSGEEFSRSVYYKAMDYPLFLVRGTGDGEVAQTDVKMGATDTVTSYAATSTLSAVIAVTRAIASPPPVLTKLAVDSNKAVANSIDSTINSLFGVAITEEQKEDQKIARWRDVYVTLMVPMSEGGWNKIRPGGSKTSNKIGDLNYRSVGKWLVYFDFPHVSAFSTEIVQCKIGPKGTVTTVYDRSSNEVHNKSDLQPTANLDGEMNCIAQMNKARNYARSDVKSHLTDVLNFPVILNHDNPITISDFLKQQDWWAAAVNALQPVAAKPAAAAAKAAPDPASVDAFCRNIRNTIGDEGFNTLDQYLVIAAVGQSSLITQAEGDALTTASCVDPNSDDPADLAAIKANADAKATSTVPPAAPTSAAKTASPKSKHARTTPANPGVSG